MRTRSTRADPSPRQIRDHQDHEDDRTGDFDQQHEDSPACTALLLVSNVSVASAARSGEFPESASEIDQGVAGVRMDVRDVDHGDVVISVGRDRREVSFDVGQSSFE